MADSTTLTIISIPSAGAHRAHRSPPLPYRMNDADNPDYEPDDGFTRHIEPAFRDHTYLADGLGDLPAPARRLILRDNFEHLVA